MAMKIVKQNKLSFVAIVVSSLFIGCLNDTVTPKELTNYTSRLVVNGVLDTKNSIALEITDSKSSFSADFPNLVKDADVTIFQNQNEIKLIYDNDFDNPRYVSNNVLNPGDVITLKVTHPRYPVVESKLRMPEDLNPIGNLLINGGTDSSGNQTDVLSVTFKDEEGRNNYYKINFKYYSRTLGKYVPMTYDAGDPSLASYNSYRLNDNSILFTDDLFKGKSKTISTLAPAGLVSFNPNEKYLIEISSISSDLFNYYKSLQRARDAGEITFEAGYNNAVVIHSNISGGLGILGAMDINEIELK
jgi:hypothetical protein